MRWESGLKKEAPKCHNVKWVKWEKMNNPSPQREPKSVPVCFSLGSGGRKREKGEREQKERQGDKGH